MSPILFLSVLLIAGAVGAPMGRQQWFRILEAAEGAPVP